MQYKLGWLHIVHNIINNSISWNNFLCIHGEHLSAVEPNNILIV